LVHPLGIRTRIECGDPGQILPATIFGIHDESVILDLTHEALETVRDQPAGR
jgi:hypothetical protein